MRSFHAYGKVSRTSQHTGKTTNALSLTTNHDITLFQETNFCDREDNHLKTILPPGYKPYYSSLSPTTAGVATVVSPNLASSHTITKTPLPSSLQGYALLLVFTAENGSSFSVLNVYLDSASPAARTKQLISLHNIISHTPFLIVGGDFNFVEDKYRDSSSQSAHYDTTKAFDKAWSDFKDKLDLKEVLQKSHTYVSGRSVDTVVSSRLDRFYLSYSEEDWATTRPFAYISSVPNSRLRSVQGFDAGDNNDNDNDNDNDNVNDNDNDNDDDHY